MGPHEWRGGGGGARRIHDLTMIKTHSEEPFKRPAPIMESLIGAYSAGKVFSGGGKKKFVCCLVDVKFMQQPPPSHFSNSFFFSSLFLAVFSFKERQR